MCLLIFSYRQHPSYRLILLANRDEFYDRPSEPAHFWQEHSGLLAGKDLKAGGTWLGITKQGRICATTNYRDPGLHINNAPSRGILVRDFLMGNSPPKEYLEEISKRAGKYNGFNLVVGDKQDLFWFSNRGPGIRKLSPGLYGLSNSLLDTPWPKVVRAKEKLKMLLSRSRFPSEQELFDLLADRAMPDDKELPDTGVGMEWERILSPIFITSPTYGTRSSTLILVDYRNKVTFLECTYGSDAKAQMTRRFEFIIE